MMLYPAMSDLLKEVNGRYLLVNLTARRAREISEYAEEQEIELTEKPVSLAIGEIADGKINALPIEE
ncbi:MAG: DNA-directed RNA polymerase subunit omega [Ruminococcaceae bacterium]|nr:DNA-directed RNA polymerase subunit omega [Oscillospiraceae bacterium]